ncbi:vanadium-dependent haloperoxidase [Flexithrix dorotheae]|uniref:vanadium-dependent haloperoxidase n=1 Tax=Flexithrix dorotheae TaxID=70993 RepID=UPI0003728B6B|nr:vanadium-dependent haloperoxidase [Flexithrix dorotheae]
MKNIFYFNLIFILIAILTGCQEGNKTDIALQNKDISKTIIKLTDVMVYDVTNPPLASRFFAYSCISGYEVIALNDPGYNSLHGVLNDFPEIQKPEIIDYSASLSAILAMLETAKKLQPSGIMLEDYKKSFLDSCIRLGFSKKVIENSEKYALDISTQILKYAQADLYNKTTSLPKYTPKEGKEYWYPTPPAYFGAVEPHFNTLRPFTLDSGAQFKPLPPVPFSEDPESDYFKMLQEVYEEGISLTEETRTIASFWDCNPFAMQTTGHLMVALKKISPGAHWMGITGIACEQANKDFNESLRIHTTVSTGMMDAFLSCWDEKYRSNRIRPETAIRKYIDPKWEPLLQTPPFPEYTSGHSTVSGAMGTILTHYFGENFSFVDDVEVKYGLPNRKFESFMAAAREAAVSRLYGGIHYRDANENGTAQGINIGKWVIKTIEGESVGQ